jgi:hypothetical protein
MIEWFAVHPWVTGVVTFFLMWSDWLLTISQERERQLHYSEHYESYPINTIDAAHGASVLGPVSFIDVLVVCFQLNSRFAATGEPRPLGSTACWRMNRGAKTKEK